MADFVHQNPGYEPADYDEQPKLPYWLYRDPGSPLALHADIRDESMGPELEAKARKLPAPKVLVRRERMPGSLTRTSGETEKVKAVVPPHMVELMRFIAAAAKSPTPLSAMTWKREQAGHLNIDDDVWLFLVMQTRRVTRPPFGGMALRMQEYRGVAPISRNIFVRDVLAHGR